MWSLDNGTIQPSHLQRHRAMLVDQVRVAAFDRAIRAVVKPGDVVVDVGSGTGILSLLALRAGASFVHAIEQGPIGGLIRPLAVANGFADRVEVHRAWSQRVELDTKVDVVIGELIGHLGVDEGIIGIFADLRARFLEPGGIVLPTLLEVWAAPTSLAGPRENEIAPWERPIAGLDFSLVAPEARSHVHLANVSTAELLAPGARMFAADLTRETSTYQQGESQFIIEREGTFEGVGVWFRSELAPDVWIDNAPESTATHWYHGFLAIRPEPVLPRDVVVLRLSTNDGVAWSWSGEVRRGSERVATFSESCIPLPFASGTRPFSSMEEGSRAIRA